MSLCYQGFVGHPSENRKTEGLQSVIGSLSIAVYWYVTDWSAQTSRSVTNKYSTYVHLQVYRYST